MTSESSCCVDELLVITRTVEELTEKLIQDESEKLIDEAKKLLDSTHLFIENNKSSIPSYILKKVSDSLKHLQRRLETINKTRMTFKFSSKPGRPGNLSEKPSVEERPTKSNENCEHLDFFGFRDKSNEDLLLGPDRIDSKDVSLINLSDCKVRLVGLANTIYIRNLKNTTVLVCLACRAVTVADCVDCNFKFICQQLRIDSTIKSSFSIFTSASSMLESSKELTFSVLDLDDLSKNENIDRKQIEDYFKRAKFNTSLNNWRCIDDFDWLSPTSASINYKICE